VTRAQGFCTLGGEGSRLERTNRGLLLGVLGTAWGSFFFIVKHSVKGCAIGGGPVVGMWMADGLRIILLQVG
jgi:hypothetical protein